MNYYPVGYKRTYNLSCISQKIEILKIFAGIGSNFQKLLTWNC